jgi:hypothetical protein
VQPGRHRLLGTLAILAVSASIAASTAMAQGRLVSGKLAGVVRDLSGTPQMGASVEVFSETPGATTSLDYLTNTQGIFRGERFAPGLYTIRVTLAGFLPTLQQHVRINPNLTTMVRIEMESIFSSLEQLRQQPNSSKAEVDDWKWVLRSASGTRPILQWDENATLTANEGNRGSSPRALLEFTDGARRPGSVSNVASAPGSSFAYDQKLPGAGRLLVAGQVSYQDSASGGVATVWLPTGVIGSGPHTAVVLREAQVGGTGITFRGARIDQGGSVTLGDRVLLSYGGEFVLVGLGRAVSSIRPRLSLETKLSSTWRSSLVFAAQPSGPNDFETGGQDLQSALSRALQELDAFPTLMWRDGRPVIQGGWHEEISAERRIGDSGKLQIAAFHDDNRHIAVFGRGSDLPPQEYFEDVFSNAFAYDGGSSGSWGGRVAYREKLSDDVEVTALFAMASALAPSASGDDGVLRDSLRMNRRQSVGVNVSAKLPGTNGRITGGYKWISDPAVSRVDSYGESVYQMDPYLHVSVRQQLPKFGPGRWEAIADCENLLAQGYVTVNTREGQVALVPAFRTFRGGLSLQF